MLGTFRFTLAWFVMLSHMPYSPFPINFNLGVTAVILFYFISGYLMYGSFSRLSSLTKRASTITFYKKRLLRIFPIYLFILLLTVVSIVILGDSAIVTLLNQDINLEKLLLNSILITNNYVFEPFTIKELLPHPLIPPSWSLSTELHFYILVPILYFMLKRESKLFYIIFILSLIFQLLSFAIYTPQFNSDNFGYRYIFGVLWIFMFGFLYASGKNRKFLKAIYAFIVFYTLFIGFYFFNHPYVKEITIALLIAPIIKVIINLDFKFDRAIGEFSYPIFLSHFLIFFWAERVVGDIENSKFLYFFIIFLMLLLFSYLIIKFERFLKRILLHI